MLLLVSDWRVWGPLAHNLLQVEKEGGQQAKAAAGCWACFESTGIAECRGKGGVPAQLPGSRRGRDCSGREGSFCG